jgi:hypothetical protein
VKRGGLEIYKKFPAIVNIVKHYGFLEVNDCGNRVWIKNLGGSEMTVSKEGLNVLYSPSGNWVNIDTQMSGLSPVWAKISYNMICFGLDHAPTYGEVPDAYDQKYDNKFEAELKRIMGNDIFEKIIQIDFDALQDENYHSEVEAIKRILLKNREQRIQMKQQKK